MKRQLTDHAVEGDSANHQLTIEVVDEPGAGGANHEYEVSNSGQVPACVSFQNGPIKENGVNGVTQEALFDALRRSLDVASATHQGAD